MTRSGSPRARARSRRTPRSRRSRGLARVNRHARSWGLLGLLVLLVGWLVGELLHSLTVIIVSVVAGVVAIVLAVTAQHHPRVVASTHHLPRPTGRKGPGPGSGGQRATARPEARKCSARCRGSVKPRQDCDCACGGRLHGTEAPRTAPRKPTRARKAREAAPPRRPGRPGEDGTRVGDTWGPWERRA